MKDYIDGKIWNTDSAKLVKYVVDVEDLGDGYTRYTQKSLMMRARDRDYFMWVVKVSTDRWCGILDKSEYLVPVSEDYVKSFRRGLPDIWPE